MNPDDLLIETLEGLCLPVFRQGSLSGEDAYPQRFYTYWVQSTEGKAFYDNRMESMTTWDIQVAFYSTSPSDAILGLGRALGALGHKGFIVSGLGYDIGSDEQSHTGRAARVSFIEKRR